MGNCMNVCLPRSSKDHHDTEMESTTTPPHQQKQPRRAGREVIKNEQGDRRRTGDVINTSDEEEEEGNLKDHDYPKKLGAGDNELGMVRVKIVLTKEELQWLMNQLKSNGEKRLENMLEEIEKGRKQKVVCDGGRSNGWKPSLESIMETPESTLLEMNKSTN